MLRSRKIRSAYDNAVADYDKVSRYDGLGEAGAEGEQTRIDDSLNDATTQAAIRSARSPTWCAASTAVITASIRSRWPLTPGGFRVHYGARRSGRHGARTENQTANGRVLDTAQIHAPGAITDRIADLEEKARSGEADAPRRTTLTRSTELTT